MALMNHRLHLRFQSFAVGDVYEVERNRDGQRSLLYRVPSVEGDEYAIWNIYIGQFPLLNGN